MQFPWLTQKEEEEEEEEEEEASRLQIQLHLSNARPCSPISTRGVVYWGHLPGYLSHLSCLFSLELCKKGLRLFMDVLFRFWLGRNFFLVGRNF